MSKNIPDKTLVVVADGHKAILLRIERSVDGFSLQEERRLSPKNLMDDGPSGSRPEDQTPRQTDEATFAKQLTNTLYDLKQTGKFDAFILFADPQTLGQLRDAMHKTVEASLVLALDKDLTNHSIADIAEAVNKAMKATLGS